MVSPARSDIDRSVVYLSPSDICLFSSKKTVFKVDDPERGASLKEFRKQFWKYVGKYIYVLTKPQKEVFDLLFFLGFRTKRIARWLGISHSAVRDRKNRGLKKLLKNIKQDDEFNHWFANLADKEQHIIQDCLSDFDL